MREEKGRRMTPFVDTSSAARQFAGSARMAMTEVERRTGGFVTAPKLRQALVVIEQAAQQCEPGGHCREVLAEAIEILHIVHNKILAATAPKGGR
jgi:hypothetical protein